MALERLAQKGGAQNPIAGIQNGSVNALTNTDLMGMLQKNPRLLMGLAGQTGFSPQMQMPEPRGSNGGGSLNSK